MKIARLQLDLVGNVALYAMLFILSFYEKEDIYIDVHAYLQHTVDMNQLLLNSYYQ